MTPSNDLSEEREMRDAALKNLEDDLDLIREEFGNRGLGARLLDLGATGVVETGRFLRDYSRRHPFRMGSTIAILATGAAAWVFRDTIGNLIQDDTLD